MPNTTDTALSALVLAWITTVVATTIFIAALAFSQLWNDAVYFQALQSALSRNV